MHAQPKAPAHLTQATREWWDSVVSQFILDVQHLPLLQLAAESWDRCQQARRALKRHGTTYEDRFGAPKPRPEVAIERDSRIAFARLLRELALDIDAPAEPYSRPPIAAANSGLRAVR